MGPDASKLGDRVVETCKRFPLNGPSISVNGKQTVLILQLRNQKHRESKQFVQDKLVAKCLNHDLNMSSLTPESKLCQQRGLNRTNVKRLFPSLLLIFSCFTRIIIEL